MSPPKKTAGKKGQRMRCGEAKKPASGVGGGGGERGRERRRERENKTRGGGAVTCTRARSWQLMQCDQMDEDDGDAKRDLGGREGGGWGDTSTREF